MLVSIFFHELGHYLLLKHYKIPISEVRIGYGLVLFEKKHNGTNFLISLIPLVGYTISDEEKIKKLSIYKCFLIDMAGIFINFLLLIFVIIYLFKFNPKFTYYLLAELTSNNSDKQATIILESLKRGITEFTIINFLFANLFIIMENILPIPHLDGGKLFYNIFKRVLLKRGYSENRINNIIKVIICILLLTGYIYVYK
jgi:membrane-associated protease RseP (regulator of RpoE activity)